MAWRQILLSITCIAAQMVSTACTQNVGPLAIIYNIFSSFTHVYGLNTVVLCSKFKPVETGAVLAKFTP